MTDIQASVTDGVAEVTISNPDVKNALGLEGMADLRDELALLGEDTSVRCIVLQGDKEGDAFCSGADVREFFMRQGDATTPELAGVIDDEPHGIIRELVSIRKPVVAKVDGAAVGAGASLALAADLTYASRRSEFGFLFVNIGLTLDSGASYVLPRLVGLKKAKELAFLGNKISSEEALELGLVNDVVDGDELDDRVDGVVDELSSGATMAIGAAKRLLEVNGVDEVDTALEREAWVQSTMFESDDMREGVEAFMSGREPDFQGR